jgi:hypothetical protein
MNFVELVNKGHQLGVKYQPGGWMTEIDKHVILGLLSNLKDPYAKLQVAEIGVFQGGSSLIYLLALPNCTFHAIDDWSGGPVSPEFTSLKEGFREVTKHFRDRIVEHDGNSVVIGDEWDINLRLDICMVDGNHDCDFPARDISSFMLYVRRGGYLLVDDCEMRCVKKACDTFLKGNPHFELIVNTTALGGKVAIYRKRKEFPGIPLDPEPCSPEYKTFQSRHGFSNTNG